MKKISIVIPAKDEEGNITPLLKRINKYISNPGYGYLKKDFEVIVVCDNCKDNTESKAKKMGAKIIRRTGNPGKSKALVEGFRAATGKILVMMDADLSHEPEELSGMLVKLKSEKNIGLVIASREAGRSDDATLVRRFGGIMLNLGTNFFFRTKLTDTINGYKVFYRQIFDKYEYKAGGYAIEIELVANTLREGMKVVEVPSYEAKRDQGLAKSKVIKDGWIFLREVVTEGISFNFEKLKKLI